MTVRTRFAPSPTGNLHVGSVRTALFCWLYARANDGTFVLRIEDTDRERSTDESVSAIFEGLRWLGMDIDEGPYYQTKRYDRYKEVIQQLLDENKAYRCNCSKERLDALRESQMKAKVKPRYDGHCRDMQIHDGGQPHVIRFKNPTNGAVEFADQVYGEISISNTELDDLIIQRSDGNPTYNLTVVVDDWDMKISHVIRGDDHINNTPRQINILRALDASIPVYAHLPMILGDDGKRLSKRHGAVNVLEFKHQGILPHALLNYLVRLGWSYGDQEIFTADEMKTLFSLDNISKGASSFNHEKLYWLNQHYQKSDPPQDVAKSLDWHFSKRGININEGPSLTKLIQYQAERCKTLSEMAEKSLYFYQDKISIDEKMWSKHIKASALEPLKLVHAKLEALAAWEEEMMHQVIIETAEHLNLKMGKIAQPVRVAVTGSSMSPPIDATLFMIGRNRVLKRLAFAINSICES